MHAENRAEPPAAASHNGFISPGLLFFLALGLLLRLPRLALRWHPANWDYAAYHLAQKPTLENPLSFFKLRDLHPPLHDHLLAFIDVFHPSIGLYMLLSVAASTLSIGVVAYAAFQWAKPEIATESAVLAAALLAASPIQVAYGAEVLNYPLLTLSLSFCLLKTRGSLRAIFSPLLAAHTHILGAVAVVIPTIWQLWQRKERWIALCLFTLGLFPLLYGVITHLSTPGGGLQPDISVGQQSLLFWQRFGWPGIVSLSLLGAGFAFAHKRLWAPTLMVLALIVFLTLTGHLRITASHQFQYLTAFTPPLAFITALAFAHRPAIRRGIGGICLILALNGGITAASDLQNLAQAVHTPQAIDRVLDEAAAGDSIWLVTANPPDDDKRHWNDRLWRWHPFMAMPAYQPEWMDYENHRYGQPRQLGDYTIHLFNKAFPKEMDALMAHYASLNRRIYIVLYDHEREPILKTGLESLLGPGQPWGAAENSQSKASQSWVWIRGGHGP